MKISLSIFKASVLAVICLFLLLVAAWNALGIDTNLGTAHKTTTSLHQIRVGFDPAASVPPRKALPSNLQTEKPNKSVSNQAPNKPGNARISEQQASAAATAAATAIALFGAAL